MPYVSRISASNTKQYQNKNEQMHWVASNLHRDQKKQSFELQSAPNLHRDKKTKKNRGIVAPSQVDCEVFVLFVRLSLCRFGAL